MLSMMWRGILLAVLVRALLGGRPPVPESQQQVGHKQPNSSISLGVKHFEAILPHKSDSPPFNALLQTLDELDELANRTQAHVLDKNDQDAIDLDVESTSQHSRQDGGWGTSRKEKMGAQNSGLGVGTQRNKTIRKSQNAQVFSASTPPLSLGPLLAGRAVIAKKSIKVPGGGWVKTGAKGVVTQSGVGSNEVAVTWHQFESISKSKYKWISTSTPIPLDQVDQTLILRTMAHDKLGWKDNGQGLGSRDPPSKKRKPSTCHNFQVDCTYPRFGEGAADAWMHRVRVVRYGDKDYGGCNYNFECMNEVPGEVDADTSEFLRAGYECKTRWIFQSQGSCFGGEKSKEGRIRNWAWDKICNVCGYTNNCVGCNKKGQPMPDKSITIGDHSTHDRELWWGVDG